MGLQSIYFGECSRGLYSRNLEHVDNFMNKLKDKPLYKHHLDAHKEEELDWTMWRMTSTGTHTQPTPRQVSEGLNIAEGLASEKESKRERNNTYTVLNSRGDFRQPGLINVKARGLSQDLKIS